MPTTKARVGGEFRCPPEAGRTVDADNDSTTVVTVCATAP